MSNFQQSYFLQLQDYIAEGSKKILSPEEQAYEDLLFSVAGIIRREGRPAAQTWLMADRGCTRHVAERILGEAINLFYATDSVRLEAWRNLLFEKMLNAARLWEQSFIDLDRETGETRCTAKAKDYEAYAKIVKQAAALKRLAERDDTPVAAQQNTQINIYGTNAQAVGIPATSRQAILDNPYFQQLPHKHQQRLEMEIGVRPLDIDQLLDSSEELAHEVAAE